MILLILTLILPIISASASMEPTLQTMARIAPGVILYSRVVHTVKTPKNALNAMKTMNLTKRPTHVKLKPRPGS